MMLAPANAMDKKKEIIETEKEELLQARVCAKNRKGLFFYFCRVGNRHIFITDRKKSEISHCNYSQVHGYPLASFAD